MWPGPIRRYSRPEPWLAAQTQIFDNVPNVQERLPALFRTLAAAGCQMVESMADRMPGSSRDVHQAGLQCMAIHTTPAGLEDLDTVVRQCCLFGARYVISSGPLQWDQRSDDDFLATAHYLQKVGEALIPHELRLLYHNHGFEFDGPTGDQPMQILLQNTKHHAVGFCFDTGAMWKAGGDYLQFIIRNANRIEIVHLRDYKGDRSVPLGRGDMPFSEMKMALMRVIDLYAVVVEQDPDTDTPLDDMVESLEFIQDLIDT